ncbi:DUF6896 domain-containing protein [Hymenobacter actinosclerus]|uniref:DUF6896 domain-containing protein n=1 Tax=Hymenobacter actinosclerus TaxID=82805 RepID=UPI000B85F9FD|nr:hypothetical protein [Hymenobacter actinosclerus]
MAFDVNPIFINIVLKQYLADVTLVVGILKAEGEKRGTSQTWQKAMYKSGEIPEMELEYDFHGIGCWVKYKDRIIDFDFRGDAGNTVFGIDPWLAAHYLQSLDLKGCYDLDICHKLIMATIYKLLSEGELVASDDVYFYTNDYYKLSKSRLFRSV